MFNGGRRNWNYFQFGDYGSLATDDRGHNEANEITARTCTGRQAPTWDATGNLTCDGDATHTVFESSTKLNYTYDYGNRMREVRDDSAQLIAAYTYHALNRRVRKVTYDDEETEVSDTWYLWDGSTGSPHGGWQARSERLCCLAGEVASRLRGS